MGSSGRDESRISLADYLRELRKSGEEVIPGFLGTFWQSAGMRS